MNINLIKAIGIPIALLSSLPAHARSHFPERRSVCDVSPKKTYYISKRVIIDGLIETTADGYHVYLIDNACPNEDIALKIPNEYGKDSGIRALVESVSQSNMAAMVGKRLHCVCDGRVRREGSDIFLLLDRVESVWSSN